MCWVGRGEGGDEREMEGREGDGGRKGEREGGRKGERGRGRREEREGRRERERGRGEKWNVKLACNLSYIEISEILIVIQSISHYEGIRYLKPSI